MLFLVFRFLFVFQLIIANYCLKENDIAILSQMQDWGKKIYRIIEDTDKAKAKGQYLVAAVLSENTLKNPKELSKTIFRGCPTKPNTKEKILECSTSAIILNSINEDTWRKSEWKNEIDYKDHPWHGEYRLVNTGIIERLIQNFHNTNGNENNCQVYLYSFYIPCADIPRCPYSCSDQVAKYNNRGDIKCKITVIGYTEVFRRSNDMRTNEDRAATVLKTSLDLYQTVKRTKVEAISNVRKSKELTFQDLMFSCLFDSPLSGCCVDVKESKVNSKLVISYFVNAMVYDAVNGAKFKNIRRMSEANRKNLAKHFDGWLQNQIHTDCSICSDRSTQSAKFQTFLISFCAKTALDLADELGQPEDPNDYTSAKWKPYTQSWQSIYGENPAEFLQRRTIMCADRSLSVNSLCTRTRAREPEIPMKRSRTPEDIPEAKLSRQN